VNIPGYLILEPGADRPYFSHSFPNEYVKKPGAKIYAFELYVSEFELVDGHVTAVAKPLVEKDPSQ
jgi:hypothetical protein